MTTNEAARERVRAAMTLLHHVRAGEIDSKDGLLAVALLLSAADACIPGGEV